MLSAEERSILRLKTTLRGLDSLVFPEAPTSRDKFRLSHNDFWQSVLLEFKNYLIGYTHDMTMHIAFILPVGLQIAGFILTYIFITSPTSILQKHCVIFGRDLYDFKLHWSKICILKT